MSNDEWTPDRLMELINAALKARDMETVSMAMRVLAVKSPQDAQTILDALALRGVLP